MTQPLGRQEPHHALLPHPKQDDYYQIPELQVCIAEALYDAEAVLSNPSAFKAEEIMTGGSERTLLGRQPIFHVPH